MNACYCPRAGDKLLRVMVHKNVGHNNLNILHFGDLVFGVFPMLEGHNLSGAMHGGSLNSVDDIMHLLLQAFEGVAYLHRSGIAHRVLFLTKFILEWYPQSSKYKVFTRPRMYIIDFETAIQFSSDEKERVTNTFPVSNRSWYRRPLAPELEIPDVTYCPFRLDVWQISTDILRFKVGLLSATEVFDNPLQRPDIQDALDALAKCMGALLLKDLMAMKMLDNEYDFVYDEETL
ncbi:uncharacterized protein BT62DRAFT_383539 [Guyanagaster necrorhizus]|uniref:Protein kinase domain-containing protein n=1 Tax=Guyanagaster necrorhizus TaxID=856835 RepID=A0A9P7VL23_9AGAR|nr:uncharacterized protein BT62DRAFT_383539 [Guyanagaster necrorhizus MCA 3950]KAG7442452.1 hypothetical protein BT62DRAFT_383539 [Guyanagaster necrorhizus MCA 3950]